MQYELVYYKNMKGEWAWLRTEGATSDKAAAETYVCLKHLDIKEAYIYVGLCAMWLWQPSFAANPTQANVNMIPKEVLALNLLNSVE